MQNVAALGVLVGIAFFDVPMSGEWALVATLSVRSHRGHGDHGETYLGGSWIRQNSDSSREHLNSGESSYGAESAFVGRDVKERGRGGRVEVSTMRGRFQQRFLATADFMATGVGDWDRRPGLVAARRRWLIRSGCRSVNCVVCTLRN